MSSMKAKLNEVIQGVLGEKIDSMYILANLIRYAMGIKGESYIFDREDLIRFSNNLFNEIAEREVEVDVYRIEKAIEGRLGICKEHVIQKDEKVMLTFEVDEKSKKTIAKAIAEQILAGNVLKVKEWLRK